MAKPIDALKVNERLYRQIAKVLDDLEQRGDELTIRDRIAALVAVGRIQTIFVSLRKEHQEDDNAGAAVRKYAGAFKAKAAHGVGRRKKATRSAARASEQPDDPIQWDDDDDSAA
jgi:hypothetical protein